MSTIQTSNGTQYETPGFWPSAGAFLAGSATQSCVMQGQSIIASPAMKKMKKLNETIDTVQIQKHLKEAMEKSGMAQKGVKFVDYTGTPPVKLHDVVQAEVKKLTESLSDVSKPFGKKVKEWGKFVKNFKDKIMLTMIKNGDNAGFVPKSNSVHINVEKLGTSGFHEIGHAINYNSSKFWKTMQKMRVPMMKVAAFLPLVALFKRKKAEGEEPKGRFDIVTTFIKENVGKLTSLAFVPIILEELKASARGNKLAKELCSPELHKQVVKSNRYGALTYVAMGVFAGVAAFAANKVRDAIAKPEEIRYAA